MFNKRNLTIALIAAILSGCGVFEDEGKLELVTDETAYEPGSPITVTATNNSSHVIYYSTCMATMLQELSRQNVVESVGFPTCACLCTAELKPGKNWEYEVDATWLWQNMGPSQPKIGPNYRFLLQFYRDKEMTKLVELSDLTTNTFQFMPHTR